MFTDVDAMFNMLKPVLALRFKQVCEKPEDPLAYMEHWVKAAKEQRSKKHNQAH